MRLLSLLIVGLLSFSTFATTVETAKGLYAERGLDADGIAKAQESADLYATLAESAEGVEKAKLLIGQSEALYFVGLMTQFNGDKNTAKVVYLKGYDAGLASANLLSDKDAAGKNVVNPKDPANAEVLAESMYWLTVNMLRWGKLNGIFQSLGKWKNLGIPRLNDMLRLDYDVMNYGAHRSAGKALLTVPGNGKIQGKTGLDFLEEAFEETAREVEGYELADNMATVTFYLEGLRKDKRADEFCEIYDTMVELMEEDDEVIGEMFPNLVPEAKYEYAEFMNEKKNTKYYSKKCE